MPPNRKQVGTGGCVFAQSLQLCLTHIATLWTVAHQAPLSMGFSRQEYQSGLPCPSSGDLPGPGMESTSPDSSALQAGSLPLNRQGSLRGALSSVGGYEVSALNYNSIP